MSLRTWSMDSPALKVNQSALAAPTSNASSDWPPMEIGIDSPE